MNYFLKKKKWLAWVIMLTFLFTSFMPSNIMAGNSVAEAAVAQGDLQPSTVVYDKDGNVVENPPAELEDGQVRLSKTATPVAGEPNTYQVTLEVEGKGVTVPSQGADIVLVLDTSGSMGNSIGSMKAAAKTFIDTVLTENSTNKVAIVSFASTASQKQGLTAYSAENLGLKNIVDNLKASGGTNTQAGIYQAEQILAGPDSTASNKMIVLLSDGEPTFNYPTKNITISDFTWSGRHSKSATASQDDYNAGKITFDYTSSSESEGDGNEMSYSQKYNNQGQKDWWNGNHTLKLNSAYAAIYESGKAKAGSTVYTIGYNTNTATNGVLTSIASDGKAYTASTADIAAIFGQIGQDINQQIKDSAVNDPIPSNVDLDVSSLSDLAAKYEDSNKITWSPDISGGKKATLTYTVKLDVEDAAFNPETAYPLNGDTTFTYKLGDGESKTVNFNVPTTPGYYGTVQTIGYLVNSVGQPINAAGEVVSIEDAVKVTDSVDMLNGASKIYFDPASTVALTAPATPTGYTAYDADARYADGKKVTVAITAGETKPQTFYYPFYQNMNVVVTALDQTYTYNGQPQGVNNGAVMTNPDTKYYEVTGLRPGDTVKELTISGSKTDAGTYADELKPSAVKIVNSKGDDVTALYNGQISYVDGDLGITPKAATITADSASKAYDGTALTDDGWKDTEPTGFVAGDEVTEVTVTGSQTTVGSSNNVPSAAVVMNGDKDVTGNYEITYVNGTLTVTDNEKALVITSGNQSWTYDGEVHKHEVYTVTYDGAVVESEDGYTFTLPTGDVLTITATAAGVKDVADTAADNNTYSYDLENEEYYTEVTANVGNLTITPATLTVNTPDATKAYDGTALTAEGSISGFVKGETATFTTTGTQTAVGYSTNTYSLVWDGTAKENNYTVAATVGTLTVTDNKKALVITSGDQSWPYDGEVHKHEVYTVTYDGAVVESEDGYTFTLPTGDVLTITATAAGVKDVADTAADNNMYSYDLENEEYYTEVTEVVGDLGITPKAATITVADEDKIVGEKDPEFIGTVVGLVDDADLGEITYSRTNSDELVGVYEDVLIASYKENPNYEVTMVPGTFTITQNDATEYKVEFYYQNPKTGEYELTEISEPRYTTSGSLVFVTKDDTATTSSMYRFNAETSTTQKTVAADGSTILQVMFDALFNVEYRYADETTSYKVASSGHVYGYNDDVVAPGMSSVDQFDGKWYKDKDQVTEWVFDTDVISENIQDPAKVEIDWNTHTIYLYTRAKVTPQNDNTLTITKNVVGTEDVANTEYGFNLKLLVKAPVETDPITGDAAEALHKVNAAKLQAEGEYRAAATALEKAEGVFRSNNMFMTTNSSLRFVMYDNEIVDAYGDTILPAIYGLTTGSAYEFEFQSYNLYEDSFAVVPAEDATVNDNDVETIVNTIKTMAGWTGEEGIMLLSVLDEPVAEPFETLDPETLLFALQEAGVNTSGSALAFGFNEASDMYLAAKDVAEKWNAFKEANAALESYMENIGRYASITVDGTKYVLNAKDANYEQDADGNYVLSFDFGLTNGASKGFNITATTGSSIRFIITETYDGGADSTTVNDVTTHSAYDFLTTGSSLQYTFVNTFEGNTPVDPVDPVDPGDDPDIEIEDPDVPLTDPEEPVIEIEDPDVPLVDVPGEEVEIDEPEVPLGDAPQTGDNSNTIPFVVLMLAAACGLVVTRRKLN